MQVDEVVGDFKRALCRAVFQVFLKIFMFCCAFEKAETPS